MQNKGPTMKRIRPRAQGRALQNREENEPHYISALDER